MAKALVYEDEKKWKKALTMWEALVALRPANSRALIGAAYCAGKQADNESDTAKIRILLENACKKYEEAIKQDDAPAIAWGNLGVTLLQLAGMAKGEKRRILLEKAREICKEAIKRDDMLAKAWVGLGVALEQLADTERDREKKRGLLEAARDRFEEAIKRNDPLALAWVCLGEVIGKIAGTEEDQEKKRLLWEMAREKYKEAIKRDGSLVSAWCGQGVALQFLAQIARDLGESDKWLELLQQAEKMAQRANEIDSRRGAYILACIASLRGDKDKCREWLEKAEKLRDLPPVEHLEEDTDMNPVRGEAWFKQLLERQRAREEEADVEDGGA